MIKEEKAFIAANKYFTKTLCPFGVGVIGSFNEEVAKKDTIRQNNFDTDNSWYEITIPSRNTFLLLDTLIKNHPDIIKKNLFSTKALAMLFYDEGKEYLKKIDSFISNRPQDEKEKLAQEEIQEFYRKKAEYLLKLDNVPTLIQYIKNKSKPKDISIASSFLAHFGITGILFFENEEERFLLFDAKNHIRIQKANFAKLENSKFINI